MGTPEVPLENAHETIEHHAHHASESWTMGVALTAAVLAAMAAITALCVEHSSEEAMRALICSSDRWNESQADSIKEKELETQKIEFETQNLLLEWQKSASPHKEMSPENKKKLAEYSTKKEELRAEAKKLEEESGSFARKHTPLSASLTMFQVAIAIGAVSVLTKQRGFWYVSIALGVVGAGFFIWGLVV
jgi:hypothetical protein